MRTIYRLRLKGTKLIDYMTTEEAKLLAMLIDTEGSICASRHYIHYRRNVYPHVYVEMRSEMPIVTAELWGGVLLKRLCKDGNYKYTWSLNDRKLLRAFLSKIKPYLQLTQKQADLALQMCDILDAKPKGYRKLLERLRREMSRLNHAPAPDIDITKLRGIIK